MNTTKCICGLVLVMMLSACVSESPRSVSGSSRHMIKADLGDQTAMLLNTRYVDTARNCSSDSTPAFLCSGIMIRGTRDNLEHPVWDPAEKDTARGAVSFSYLRADTRYKKLAYSYSNGYIMDAYFKASGKFHPEVRCFFPIDGSSNDRALQGCGEYPGYVGSGQCHTVGVLTAAQWWAHYDANTDDRRRRQCGFDVSDDRNAQAGPAFAAGIEAMALAGDESFGTQNEMVLTVWEAGLGKTLPLQAFFYAAGSADGLTVARRNQTDLKTREDVTVPVIKVTLPQSETDLASFTYAVADQAVPMPAVPDLGDKVAADLTARYADTAVGCDNNSSPAYLCSGIVIRGTRDNLEQPVWDVADKDIARGAVTFAYMRADATYKAIINNYSNGFIFKPYASAAGQLHPQVRCFFPLAASTDSRAEQGCGAHPSWPKSGPCRTSGVVSAEQWWAHFNNEAGGNIQGQCGFSLTQDNQLHDFAAGIAAMKLAGERSFQSSNELLLSPWENGQGKDLPLEAFFYVAGSSSGLEVARRNQRSLIDQEKVIIPVIKIGLPQTPGERATFHYDVDDQVMPMPVVVAPR